VTKIISLAAVNLVTPKAGAMQEHLFEEPASDTQAKLVHFCFYIGGTREPLLKEET